MGRNVFQPSFMHTMFVENFRCRLATVALARLAVWVQYFSHGKYIIWFCLLLNGMIPSWKAGRV